MLKKKPDAQRRLMQLAISLCALTCAVPAFGQSAPGPDASGQGAAPAKNSNAKRPAVSSAKPTSPNATINLVNLLVKQGVLTEDQAQTLIKQADDEAYVARQAAKDATVKADEAARAATASTAGGFTPGKLRRTHLPG